MDIYDFDQQFWKVIICLKKKTKFFYKRLMCLSIKWKLYTCRISNREQLGKIHQL